MRAFAAALVISLALAGSAHAGLTERDLAGAVLAPPPGARVPLTLPVQDAAGRSLAFGAALGGRPALLIPVDYTCRTICGPALAIAADALAETGLRPGADYTLITVGLDPKDSPADARALVEARIPDPALAGATVILTGGAGAGALLEAVGYRAAYDAETDQFAHPAGALALTPDGRVARALSSLALNPRDLRLALVEAGEGRIGTLADHVTLLCSGFDPVHGVYTPLIRRLLTIAGALTVAALAAALVWLHRRVGPQPQGGG